MDPLAERLWKITCGAAVSVALLSPFLNQLQKTPPAVPQAISLSIRDLQWQQAKLLTQMRGCEVNYPAWQKQMAALESQIAGIVKSAPVDAGLCKKDKPCEWILNADSLSWQKVPPPPEERKK